MRTSRRKEFVSVRQKQILKVHIYFQCYSKLCCVTPFVWEAICMNTSHTLHNALNSQSRSPGFHVPVGQSCLVWYPFSLCLCSLSKWGYRHSVNIIYHLSVVLLMHFFFLAFPLFHVFVFIYLFFIAFFLFL